MIAPVQSPPARNAGPTLSDADYTLFRDLIASRTGIVLDGHRRSALARGVVSSALKSGTDDLESFYRRLVEHPTESHAWHELIDEVTVGETYFFRNAPHMEALRNHILPQLIAHHRVDRRLRIWSAGCSTGEEPYTLAMLLDQLIPDLTGWNIFILGTDINLSAIEKARQARYGRASFRETDTLTQERYFSPAPDRTWTLRPDIRDRVTFAYLNLTEDTYPALATLTHAMDLIVCRNVAIYLPPDIMRDVAIRFHKCIVPDGWLLVGPAETDCNVYHAFRTVTFDGTFAYRKTGEGQIPPASPEVPFPAFPYTGVSIPAPGPLAASPVIPTLPTSSPAPTLDVPATPTPSFADTLKLIEQGSYHTAIRILKNNLARGSDPAAHCCCAIARAYANMGWIIEAEQWAREAIRQDPLAIDSHYMLSLLSQERREPKDAIAHLKRTLYLDPDFLMAHFNLARLYRQEGQPDAAGRHRLLAIRLASRRPPDERIPAGEGMTHGELLPLIQEL